ncbi:MAG: RDD family protein [Armatimonadota bacterium]|nr:RDD family protein [bacterium]
MKCPKCNYENKDDAHICVKCYFDLNSGKTPVNAPASNAADRKTASPLPITPPAPVAASTASTVQDNPETPQTFAPSATPNSGFDAVPSYVAPVAMRDYAGFGIRLCAYLIDGIVLLAVAYLISKITGGSAVPANTGGPLTPEQNAKAITTALNGGNNGVAITNLVQALYFIGMHTAFGATLGKMAMGIKVMKEDGSPIGVGTAIVRYLAEGILAAVTCCLMFISVATSDTKRGWHDRAAGTIVVRNR